MGYFNYFIKCIIRNISRMICKPKVLLTLLLCFILIFFVLQNYGYCEAVPVQPGEYNDGQVNQYDNTFLTLVKIQEEIQLRSIARLYFYLENKRDECIPFLRHLYQEMGGLCLYVYEGPSEGDYYFGFYKRSNMSVITDEFWAYHYHGQIFELTSYVKGSPWFYSLLSGNFSSGSSPRETMFPSAFVGVLVPEWIDLFKTAGIISSEQDAQSIVSAINQNNQIQQEVVQQQQEQNRLQQEQNDFLKKEPDNSDVAVNDFSSVDSNDITSTGLSSIFTSIYNSISNWKSKDIELPIPYTNTSIKIQANYTETMLKNAGGNWLITFIHTVYYFIVARFMIYSITKIIDEIKSGKILDTESSSNITTDML